MSTRSLKKARFLFHFLVTISVALISHPLNKDNWPSKKKQIE